jgi:ABC-type bacteriocin/lantibiotic exporter with double-glycine peptidase domain
MVLHHGGMVVEQAKLAHQLGVEPDVGIPASRISRLASRRIKVTYKIGEWATVQTWLSQNVPVIAMIQAGELPHWQGEAFTHAVVVIGYDATLIWLLDPAAQPEPMVVSIDEFMLAWGEIDYRYAVVSVSAKP